MTPQEAIQAFNLGCPVIFRRARDEIEYEAITALIQRKNKGKTELFAELKDYCKNSVTVAPISYVYNK